jgi:hypothetical protein
MRPRHACGIHHTVARRFGLDSGLLTPTHITFYVVWNLREF